MDKQQGRFATGNTGLLQLPSTEHLLVSREELKDRVDVAGWLAAPVADWLCFPLTD